MGDLKCIYTDIQQIKYVSNSAHVRRSFRPINQLDDSTWILLYPSVNGSVESFNHCWNNVDGYKDILNFNVT